MQKQTNQPPGPQICIPVSPFIKTNSEPATPAPQRAVGSFVAHLYSCLGSCTGSYSLGKICSKSCFLGPLKIHAVPNQYIVMCDLHRIKKCTKDERVRNASTLESRGKSVPDFVINA